ncbi:MAG: hypothetical protein H6551_12155 [Chitinophagales bacterium]|nr:hypothetical protein [Chitinophagaceae bacterium]MCB9065882.1 hypothetical protein [Chitinophagales bacterium]
MKEARITRLSRHHNRANKLKKAKIKSVAIDRNEIDKQIIDLVLKTLYYNSHIDVLHMEDDIFKAANLKLPYVESERIWEVLLNSGLVNPVAGFGMAGKLELSRTGYQLMAQYGGYMEYMDALTKSNNPTQIVIEQESDCAELGDEEKSGHEEEEPPIKTPKGD